MAKQLTTKQRAFLMFYTSNGGNAAAAYRAAYKTNTSPTLCANEGARLLKHPLIAPIIAEFREKSRSEIARAAEAETITKASLSATMARLLRNAADDGDVRGAAVAGTLIAKLSGWIIERRDIRQIKSLNDLSDEELAAIKAEAQKELEDQANGVVRH